MSVKGVALLAFSTCFVSAIPVPAEVISASECCHKGLGL